MKTIEYEEIKLNVPKGSTVDIKVDGKEYKPESKVWSPVGGEECFIVGGDGAGSIGFYMKFKLEYHKQGRAFETKAEADLFAERERLVTAYTRRIAELNAEQGWEADWDNRNQNKCFTVRNHGLGTWIYTSETYVQALSDDQYGSAHTIKSVNKEFSGDLKLIITGER